MHWRDETYPTWKYDIHSIMVNIPFSLNSFTYCILVFVSGTFSHIVFILLDMSWWMNKKNDTANHWLFWNLCYWILLKKLVYYDLWYCFWFVCYMTQYSISSKTIILFMLTHIFPINLFFHVGKFMDENIGEKVRIKDFFSWTVN